MTDETTTVLARVPSGIDGLDIILGGGFLKGGLYIIQGPPGTGKTTFGNQVCFNHAAGDGRAVYVTLLAEYHARMMQHLGTMTFFDASKIPDQSLTSMAWRRCMNPGSKGWWRFCAVRSPRGAPLCWCLMASCQPDAWRRMSRRSTNLFTSFRPSPSQQSALVFILTSAQSNIIETEHTMVDGIVELVDELTGWAAASSLQVVKFRGSGFLRGRHAFKITERGIIVHPRIEALLARPSQPDPGVDARVPSGLEQLDIMLGGGFPEASTTMVMGPSGTGKTTLGLTFLSRSSEAEPGLLFGFYETPKRIDAKVAGVCPALRDLIDSGAVEVLWQPPTDDLLDAYSERLLQAVHRRKVRRLFIDGLGAFQAADTGSGAGRIGMFLTALMNEMRVLGVTTVYTLEVPDIMGPTIRTSIGDLSSLAENLVMLRFVEVGSQLHRLISVLKVRDSQFDQSLHEYTTSSQGLVIDPTSDSAQAIMFGFARQAMGEPGGKPPPQTGHGG